MTPWCPLGQELWTYGTCAQNGTLKVFHGTRHSLVCQFFLITCAWPASLHRKEHVYIYTHICDCVQAGYALPLLPNNTASETFLHISGTVRSVGWIFIIAVPAWRWLGEYIGQKVLLSFLQTGSSSNPSYVHIFFLNLFFEEACIRNIIIILYINYIIIICIKDNNSVNNNNYYVEGSKNLFWSSIVPWACERISSKCIENLGIRPPKYLSVLLWDYTSTQRHKDRLENWSRAIVLLLRQSYCPLIGRSPVQLLLFLLDITPLEDISIKWGWLAVPCLVGAGHRARPQPTFCVSVDIWWHSDSLILLPFSWTFSTSQIWVWEQYDTFVNEQGSHELNFSLRQAWRIYGSRKDYLGTRHWLLPHTSVALLWRMCVYTHCDNVQTVYALLLLPNNTASEIFLHKPEAVWLVDWKFIPGAPAWKWLL